MKALTNKELQEKLQHYPDDMLVFISRRGNMYTKCDYVRKRWLSPINKECLILESEVPYPTDSVHKKSIKGILLKFIKQFKNA
jgi:hypothetical protein